MRAANTPMCGRWHAIGLLSAQMDAVIRAASGDDWHDAMPEALQELIVLAGRILAGEYRHPDAMTDREAHHGAR